MDISKFAKKPELVKIVIDDQIIKDSYGSEINFWIYDSIDITTYFDFFKSQADNDGAKLNDLMRKIILNEQGEICIPDDHILPVDIAVASLTAINERLGKSRTKPSTPETGNQ